MVTILANGKFILQNIRNKNPGVRKVDHQAYEKHVFQHNWQKWVYKDGTSLKHITEETVWATMAVYNFYAILIETSESIILVELYWFVALNKVLTIKH